MFKKSYYGGVVAALGLLGCSSHREAEQASSLIGDPTIGGPYGNLPTYRCSNLGGSFCLSDPWTPPLRAAEDVVGYMDHAATNWGCDWELAHHEVTSGGGGNYVKSYGTAADPARGCGIVWWNHARQAAYFLSTSDRGRLATVTSSKLHARYCALGCDPQGPLGLPISNPTPYGATGATYQQFTRGIITHVASSDAAFAVGGTGAELALAETYAAHFGISPTTAPAVFGLSSDARCTSASGATCDHTQNGRFVGWRNTASGDDELVVARTGWREAVVVSGPILRTWRAAYGAAPWNGALGFPITDLRPTGSPTHHQEFEAGTILWALDRCTSGTYAARIVTTQRRPITEGNLAMLCEPAPPVNRELTRETQPIPFSAAGRAGSYTFHAGREEVGWFKGVTVRFNGGAPIEVTGPLYHAWIGGATGRATVLEALSGGAAGWGAPTADAACADSLCTVYKQPFGLGSASVGSNGLVGWAPDSAFHPGLYAPIGLTSSRWGYTTPPIPADIRALAGVPRSGDFVTLAWLNQSTASGVTTRIHRAVKPLGGSLGPFVVIATPATLPSGVSSSFADTTAVNNAQNCYYLSVSDPTGTINGPAYCVHTLDATVEPSVADHSVIRKIGRARIRIDVPAAPSDSGTAHAVAVRLSSNGWGFDYNLTFVDSTAQDFLAGSTNTFDLGLAGGSNNAPPDLGGTPIGVDDVADISGIEIFAYRRQGQADNLRISRIELTLDNVSVFAKSFDPPFEVVNSELPGGTRLEVPFDELRAHARWNKIYAASATEFVGLEAGELKKKLDSVLGNAVRRAPGANYHGTRLRDGAASALTRLAEDRLHVVQAIRASDVDDVDCVLSYDLQIVARDLDGNIVDHLNNPVGPGGVFGTIFANEMRLENAHADCDTGFWKHLLNDVIAGFGFSDRLGNLEDELERAFQGMAPSHISASPAVNTHVCFPMNGSFANGGFSVCAG